jgi:DNA topoisomerase VI subunit A
MAEERKTMPASSFLNSREPDPTQLTEERIAEILKQMEEMQKRYADRAATILSPAQFQQFTKWQQQMSAMQTMGLKMAAKMFKQKTSEPISP